MLERCKACNKPLQYEDLAYDPLRELCMPCKASVNEILREMLHPTLNSKKPDNES